MTWRAFWGLVLVGLGVLFLLVNLGYLPGSAWNYFLPAFLVLLGVVLLFGLRGGGRVETVEASAPLEGAKSALLTLKHGAGKLQVSAGANPDELFSGSFGGGVEKKVTRRGDRVEVELRLPGNAWSRMRVGSWQALSWSIALNPTIPLDLKLEGGASDNKLDLSGLKLANLELNTGASSTEVLLPPPVGTTHVKLNAGAASVKVRLPPNTPARIHGKMGLGSLKVDMVRYPNRGTAYESDDFATASDRVEIEVEGGVGSVEIQ